MKRPFPNKTSIVAASLSVFAPQAAAAHLVSTGMGPLYDGISHFGLSPEDFLPVIGLALFAGLRGPAHARPVLFVLSLSWLAGGLLAMAGWAPAAVSLTVATAVLFLAIGGALAADLSVPPLVCAIAAGALGLVRGVAGLAGVDATPAHGLTLLGMCASVFVVFAIAASLTLPLKRAWMIVAARVGGSWLAATGLLLAGWLMRYGAAIR